MKTAFKVGLLGKPVGALLLAFFASALLASAVRAQSLPDKLGDLVGDNGQLLSSAQVGVSVVPPELVEGMLPAHSSRFNASTLLTIQRSEADITVQAMGVSTFSTPAPMTFPNVFNAPPGTRLNFLSFDHTTGRLVIEGTAKTRHPVQVRPTSVQHVRRRRTQPSRSSSFTSTPPFQLDLPVRRG